MSKGEKAVKRFLVGHKIDFVTQKKFPGLKGMKGGSLSYDFYLATYNVLIEVQGAQHYKPISRFGARKGFIVQQEHDRRKRSYAKDNGYTLIELSTKDAEIKRELTKLIKG